MKEDAVVLIGMAGVGKSTIGKALAEVLTFDFIDLDEYIAKKDGKIVQKIIAEEGEEALLQIEKRRMYEINLFRVIVAPGGSIIYHPDLMEYLKRRAFLIHLDDSFKEIEARLINPSERGIVGLKSKTLKQIYDQRRPLYFNYADIIVDCRSKAIEQLVNEIKKQVSSQF